MSPRNLLCLIPLLFAPIVLAGSNAGGVLLLHAAPSIVYSEGTSYCGRSGLSSGSPAVTSVPADPAISTVFYVVAAFADSARPTLAGISFGIEYDPDAFVVEGSAHCAGLEIQQPGWPASGTGIALAWPDPPNDRLVGVYWFAGHVRASGAATVVRLIPHPVQGGDFADSRIPSRLDEITEYGSLGFGVPGSAPFPKAVKEEEPVPVPEAKFDPECTFPTVVHIPPEDMLIVQTEEDSVAFSGTDVTLDWRPGDTLRVNGIPLAPRRPPAEARARERYGDVPLVRQLVESGLSWSAAAAAFRDSAQALLLATDRAYHEGARCGANPDSAIQGALRVARRNPILDPSATGVVTHVNGHPEWDYWDRALMFAFRGWTPSTAVFSPARMSRLVVIQADTRENACGFAFRLRLRMEDSRHGNYALVVNRLDVREAWGTEANEVIRSARGQQ